MALQVIADDIYYLVFEELDRRSDVSAFMRSSRSFFHIGVDRLLKMGVYIYTDNELASFCHFMKRNFITVHIAASQLEELTISIDWVDKEDTTSVDRPSDKESIKSTQGASLLVPVLGYLTGLQRLTIESCEMLLQCDEQLVAAFAALTTLGELNVTGFGLLTYQVIADVRSYLCKIYVDCGYEIPNQPAENHTSQGLDLLDPLQMLCRHQGTLQEVTIHAANMTARLPRTNDYAFAQVHILALKRCYVRERELVMNAFPNVNWLEMFWIEVSNGQEDPSVNVDEIRAVNLAFPMQWAPLDFVYADVDSLFALAFKSRVHRLDVALWELEAIDIEHLRTVLADVQPRHLVVQWGYWDAFRELSVEISPELLGQLFAGVEERIINEITHFGLDLGLKNLIDDPALYTVCAASSCCTHFADNHFHDNKDAVAQLLASLPRVRCFAFRLHAVSREYEDDFANATPEDREDDIVEVLAAGFDVEILAALAAQIASAARSVTLLCFFVMSRRVFWRVARDASGSLTRIGEEEGEHLMAAEGILWHCPSKIWWPRNPSHDE
ncbi:hypothetical protein TRAPUB_11352 [Trametes pubescens]|uniref:F-box domain-containing protein n=1 Tax=Trametes pubescens TaxID=154538 RepID=A0A1M2VX51_TRAPU|nr:hypothetical protein TRAPUB_11352 [Trametes pubescens]